MPSIAFSSLRPGFARSTGFYRSFNTTTNITTDKNVVSTELRDLGHFADSVLNNKWVYIKGTTNDRLSREVDAYTASSGTCALRSEDLSAETVAKAIEMMNYSPARLKDLLNEARRLVLPYGLHKPTDYEIPTVGGAQRLYRLPSGLFIGTPTDVLLGNLTQMTSESNENLLQDKDPDFEDPTGSNWVTSSLTVAKEADTSEPNNYAVLTGDNSAKLTATLNTVGTILSTVINGGNYDGEEINSAIWVYCLTASRVEAIIDEDGTITAGTQHQGLGWEKLTVRLSLGDVTTLKLGLRVTSGAVIIFYADNIHATAAPLEIAEESYIRLTNFGYHRPRGTATDGYLEFPVALDAGKVLRIRGGRDYISSVDAEADTMEIDEHQAQLLYAVAREMLYSEEVAEGNGGDDMKRLLEQTRALEIPQWIRTIKARADRPPLKVGLNSW